MQKIIPLKYKIKLWKSCLSDDKIKKYKDPLYFKEFLEDMFKLSEHKIDNKKIFIKRYSLKDVSIEEDIEIDDFNGKNFIFVKFKYGDKIAKNDNGKIVEEGEVIQEVADKGSLLTDFYFGIDFKLRDDSKFFILEGVITIIQKGNEQMKAQLLELISKDLYLQDDIKTYSPEYKLDFKFEDQELEKIKDKVKGLELLTEFKPESELDQAESGTKFKDVPIKISIGGGNQGEIFDSIKGVFKQIPGISGIRKRAIIKQGKSILRSDFSSDGLKLSLKDSFLYSDENIDYEKFKKETYKYVFPGMDFED